ncbi:MAG: DUF4389 domain-containing protein [Mycobacterium sp.]|nr:DUF4389 domain-containing protein [Mycobacterium sp.]
MLPQTADYPVRVRGDLDPALSRWQWLVKWILAIPHYIVLFFLHIAVVVVFVIAFFAILITGKYPRALFDFSVGVARWRWRVAFYALTVVGTDKYPPFSLQPKPDYPADLTVDYPEHLSRGLVLIKWWLLAIPHYVMILAFFTAGEVRIQLHPGEWISVPLLSVVSLLLTFAVVALLLTGRYPKGLYDLVLGLNRWAIRVRVYAVLLRDEYPPFRLDLGPREPQHAVSPTSPEPQDI